MGTVETTRMTAEGRIEIPESVRRRLGLRPGVEFAVVGNGDAVILRPLAPPSLSDFDTLAAEARRQARRAGMRRSDVAEAVRRVRGRR